MGESGRVEAEADERRDETAPGSVPAGSAETWTVATFNVVGFGLALVLAGHASGALSDALPGVGTLPGLVVFAYLWALVVLATRWVFAAGGLRRSREGAFGRLLARGVAGGALVGGAFVAGIALTIAAVNVLDGMVDVPAFALLFSLGVAFGLVVGGVVGTAFALVDAALYRASALLLPAST